MAEVEDVRAFVNRILNVDGRLGAVEIDRITDEIRGLVEAVRADEREACAKVADAAALRAMANPQAKPAGIALAIGAAIHTRGFHGE